MNIRARLFRVSFSGELAFELAVPARYGDATIRALMRRGRGSGASFPMAPKPSASCASRKVMSPAMS